MSIIFLHQRVITLDSAENEIHSRYFNRWVEFSKLIHGLIRLVGTGKIVNIMGHLANGSVCVREAEKSIETRVTETSKGIVLLQSEIRLISDVDEPRKILQIILRYFHACLTHKRIAVILDIQSRVYVQEGYINTLIAIFPGVRFWD